MVGLEPLILVPHVLLCVVPPSDNIFGPLGSNLGFPHSLCVGLFCVWPYFLLLAYRPAIGVGAAVRVYLLWPGVVSVVLGMLWGVELLLAWGMCWCLHGHHGEFSSEFSSICAILFSAWVALSAYFLPLTLANPHQLDISHRAWLFHRPTYLL